MGYTHYFTTKEIGITKQEVDLLVEHIEEVFDDHKDIIQSEYDDPSPPNLMCIFKVGISKGFHIATSFNGIGDDGHETFWIDTSISESSFCKTNRKPYDIVVCIILLMLKHHLQEGIGIRSDGFSNYQKGNKYGVGDVVDPADLDGTWAKAAAYIKTKFGIKFQFVVNEVYGDKGKYFSYTPSGN